MPLDIDLSEFQNQFADLTVRVVVSESTPERPSVMIGDPHVRLP